MEMDEQASKWAKDFLGNNSFIYVFCEDEVLYSAMTMWEFVTEMNDTYQMSIEEIADFVEKIENNPKARIAEVILDDSILKFA